ncbi:glycosyltransferase family 2 protein [Methanobrevibacter sp.]|uniref:glycosyltransferase family 2 protein n=1 Tax=Methanobrevibacter sp. TaxID=66852 RepID=UPI0025D767D7|nr:glycosyltransferase family 2 protein [Methanobrevibacter sp.]MBQ2831191.1 glycosyltransferase family 2 protein [Methanobrevibacter sp.]
MVKVSVIMPVYNAEDYLEDAIGGILNQTLDDWELICVDDGSADSSLEILNEFASNDSRIKVYHQENRGGGAARNVALTHTTGEYLYCMDADDSIEPYALEECYEIATQKDLDFIIFQANNYDVDTDTYNNFRIFRMDNIADKVGESIFSYRDLGDLIFDTSSTPWCKFYNLDFVKRTGAQFAEGLIFHDNIFWWEILLNGERIYFYRKYLYTRNNHSKSSTGAGDRRYLDAIPISNMIWDIFFRYGQFDNYRKGLGMRKFDKVLHWYDRIQEDLKEEYFQAMKEDYEKIAEDKEFCDNFVPEISKKSKDIFLNTLKATNHEEFDELMGETMPKKQDNPGIFKKAFKKIFK